MKVRAETRRLSHPLPGGKAGTTVAVELFRAGEFSTPRAFVESARPFPVLRMAGIGTPRSRYLTLPCLAFLIHHPSAGPFLVDTGLHPSVTARPAENLGRLTASLGRARLEPGEDVPTRLRERGIDPKQVGLVVMTHMHFDHASAMSEFPNASFVLTEEEWESATTERRPMLHGYRRSHFDYAFDYRTISYDDPSVESYATFGRTFDVFGDGSVRLASTPGHSAGHQSVICRLADRDLVIAGDAVYTMAQLADAPEPPRPYDRHNWRRSMRELKHFAEQYPQAVIVPGHDQAHWDTLEQRYE